jgi:hypothetical protein
MGIGRHRPDVITWNELDPGSAQPGTDPDFFDLHLLAEGDSWFTLGGIPTSNYLFNLRFHENTMIVNCGTFGDTIKHMADLTDNPDFRAALSAQDGLPWHALLLSGGGNDLIDEARNIILPLASRPAMAMPNPEDYCDPTQLAQLVSTVQTGYQTLVGLRDAPGSPAQDQPVITHTYDFPTPRNAPARFFSVGILGPWLYSAMTEAQVPEQDWQALSDYLLNVLGDTILGLTQGPNALPNFHVLETRGVLKRAKPNTTGASRDWLNEIHPDFDGYKKLARKMSELLDGILGF